MGTDYSYSKLDTYHQCPFKFRLMYLDNHYIKTRSIATDFGSLVHYIEEHIGIDLKNGVVIDYDYYRNLFLNIDLNTDEEQITGVNLLKKLYPVDWNKPDKQGYTYEDKCISYIDNGIYLLEKFMIDNPDLIIYDLELPFTVQLKNKMFKGFIDRVFYNTKEDTYIIEDIKTYSKKILAKDLRESLQMYIYSMALKELIGPSINIECYYAMPLISVRQYSQLDIRKIFTSLETMLNGISEGDFHPNPTPLCHWCVFSKTYPNQPDEAKNLCPYFSHWTKDSKTFDVESKWCGDSWHPSILESFKQKNSVDNKNHV